MKNRRECDNAIIIREIIFKMNKYRGKNHHMLLKIDLAKAYDCLEWSLIYRTIFFYGFPPKNTKLIMNCITSSRIAVLVNCSRTEFFIPSRGIRQGNPMSPYLFILCMEMLFTLINYNVDMRHWDPISIGRNNYQLSHLFFVDDLNLMNIFNNKTIHNIKHCLNLFCSLSGQSINRAKSKIVMSKHCPKTDAQILLIYSI